MSDRPSRFRGASAADDADLSGVESSHDVATAPVEPEGTPDLFGASAAPSATSEDAAVTASVAPELVSPSSVPGPSAARRLHDAMRGAAVDPLSVDEMNALVERIMADATRPVGPSAARTTGPAPAAAPAAAPVASAVASAPLATPPGASPTRFAQLKAITQKTVVRRSLMGAGIATTLVIGAFALKAVHAANADRQAPTPAAAAAVAGPAQAAQQSKAGFEAVYQILDAAHDAARGVAPDQATRAGQLLAERVLLDKAFTAVTDPAGRAAILSIDARRAIELRDAHAMYDVLLKYDNIPDAATDSRVRQTVGRLADEISHYWMAQGDVALAQEWNRKAVAAYKAAEEAGFTLTSAGWTATTLQQMKTALEQADADRDQLHGASPKMVAGYNITLSAGTRAYNARWRTALGQGSATPAARTR